MGCCTWRSKVNFGPLKTQSRLPAFFTMVLIFTYFFYSLTGYGDYLSSPAYDPETATNGVEYGAQGTSQSGVGAPVRFPPHPMSRRNRTQRPWSNELSPRRQMRGDISILSNTGLRRFPQAIIIGVKKGGTRALLEFLRIHPDVRAVGSEPHFFDRFYDKGLEWYRSLMPRTLDGQITMEKTPSYFVTREAPQRVFALSPQTKLIVVVRDPVTRAISDYTQTKSKNLALPPFQDLAFRNGSHSPVDTSWSAVRIGIYAKHLENWLHFFPPSSFLFVSGEQLVLDPAGEVGRVQDFLGLRRIVGDKHFYFNQTKGFPCLKKPEGSSRPRCLGKSKGRPHPPIPQGALQRLRDFYRPFNFKFYQMSGQDFGWD